MIEHHIEDLPYCQQCDSKWSGIFDGRGTERFVCIPMTCSGCDRPGMLYGFRGYPLLYVLVVASRERKIPQPVTRSIEQVIGRTFREAIARGQANQPLMLSNQWTSHGIEVYTPDLWGTWTIML